MKVRIYTHRDFDGVVSGAILYHAFMKYFPRMDVTFVNYSDQPRDQWRSFDFPEQVVFVSDFPFSESLLTKPRFFIWADHHLITDPDYAIPTHADNGVILYNKDALSCAQILAPLAPPLADLVKWTNIVDSAGYESVEQALLMSEPALRIAAACSQLWSDTDLGMILRELAVTCDAEYVSNLSVVAEAHRKYCWKQNRALEYLKETLIVHRGKYVVGICSFVGQRFSSRYAAFAVEPDLDFLIYIRQIPPWDADRISLSISYNPWKEVEPRVNLGELIATLDNTAGGHEKIGATVVESMAEATILARRLVESLESM